MKGSFFKKIIIIKSGLVILYRETEAVGRNHIPDKVTQNVTSVIKVRQDEEITSVASFINDLELLEITPVGTNLQTWHLEVENEAIEHTFEV